MSRKGCPNKVSHKIVFCCENCNKEWLDYPSRVGRKHFCSKHCWDISDKKKRITSHRSIGNTWGSVRKITPELRQKMSLASKGKKRPNIAKSKMGNLNPNWKGGITPENKLIRMSAEFMEWRKKVFERDDYTCQACGVRGGILHPHHIKQFAYFPELGFAVSNGQTLCSPCHRKTDTWGFKKHKLPEEQK